MLELSSDGPTTAGRSRDPGVTRPMVGIGRTEGKLADNAANVRAGLDEAFEAGRQRVPAEEAVLKHGSDRLG